MILYWYHPSAWTSIVNHRTKPTHRSGARCAHQHCKPWSNLLNLNCVSCGLGLQVNSRRCPVQHEVGFRPSSIKANEWHCQRTMYFGGIGRVVLTHPDWVARRLSGSGTGPAGPKTCHQEAFHLVHCSSEVYTIIYTTFGFIKNIYNHNRALKASE